MNTNDEEIGFLNRYLTDLGHQISLAVSKHDIAASVAEKLAAEARHLKELHLQTAKQLRDMELHQSGMYMWENIGEGG